MAGMVSMMATAMNSVTATQTEGVMATQWKARR
jgi:hypothetical protein